MAISFSPQPTRAPRARGAGVTAVLGPTNTGKTHLAIERMLGHSSGLIGLPLRLLAREVYNKVADRAGKDAVALITGEEKIKPPNPRYWVSTVEAMPRDLDVAFLAVDEVQLGADFERGHVFTDRMLNMRAREETLVLGAATVRPMVEKLLPGAHIISRPRLSTLTYAGEKKLTRLPSRSAIVAFSAEEVYAIAELIRRQLVARNDHDYRLMLAICDLILQLASVTNGELAIIGVFPAPWAADRRVFYFLALLLCTFAIVGMRRLMFSPFGYSLRAGRDSELRAEATGINVRRQKWIAFVIAGAASGLAGGLTLYQKAGAFPAFIDLHASIDVYVMALLGHG